MLPIRAFSSHSKDQLRLLKLASSQCNQNLNLQIKRNIACTSALKQNLQKDNANQLITNIKSRFYIEPTPLRSSHQGEWPKITLFGDSITQYSFDVNNGCWASMLKHRCVEYFDIDCRGFSGYTTRQALPALKQLFSPSYLKKVELFIEFFGHNDSWENYELSVDVKEYEEHCRLMVEYLLKNNLPAEKILLITPLWYESKAAKEFMKNFGVNDFGKSLEHAQKYSEAKLKIGKEFNITCFDAFKFSKDYKPLEDLFYDGIHLSRKGADAFFGELMPLVENKIEKNFRKPLKHLFHLPPFENLPEIRGMFQRLTKLSSIKSEL